MEKTKRERVPNIRNEKLKEENAKEASQVESKRKVGHDMGLDKGGRGEMEHDIGSVDKRGGGDIRNSPVNL